METQDALPSERPSTEPATDKKTYESPSATFVPFAQQERLSWNSGCDPTTCTEGSYIK